MTRARMHRPAAAAALALTAMVTLTACHSSSVAVSAPTTPDSGAAATLPPAPPSTDAPSTDAPTTDAPSAAASPSVAPSPAASRGTSSAPTPATTATSGRLDMGSSGPAVLRLQQRLATLGYWAGTPDGKFGPTTEQAVFALQKAASLSPSGAVTPATQKALDAGRKPTAKSTSGRVIEVNLARDLLMFVTDGHVNYTLNTSTGGGYVYYDQGNRNVATTPRGHFSTYRVIDGEHRSTLGLLFRPRYFTGGYAIHGDSDVPAHPASHGCVRVTDAAIDWIWASDLDPIGTPVWVY